MRWFARLPDSLRARPVASSAIAVFRVAMVIILPFFLLSGLNQYFSAEDLNGRIAAEKQSMSQVLSNISTQAEPAVLFNSVFQALTTQNYPSDGFLKRFAQIHAEHSRALEAYFFDSAGSCVTLPGMPVPPKYVAQKFLEAVLNPALGKKYERFLLQLSGYRNAHYSINRSPGSIVSIGTSHDRQWAGWFKLHDAAGKISGHLLVFIRKGALAPDLMLENSILTARKKFGRNYFFAWQDPSEPQVLRPDSTGFSSEIINQISSIAYGESGFVDSGCPGVRLIAGNGVAVLARTVRPVDEATVFVLTRFILITLALCAFLFLVPVSLGITSYSPGLKLRLSALFLFGAGIPLILLIFTGIADRIEREKVLINDYQQASIKDLTRIDEGMTFEYRRLEGIFSSAMRKCSMMPPREFEKSLQALGALLPSFSESVRQILVVEKDWNISFSRQTPLGKRNNKKESMVLYGEMLLEVIRGKYLDPAQAGGSTDLKSVVSNFGGWMSKALIMGSGKIIPLSIIDSIVPTYIDFFLDQANRARAIAFVFLSRPAVQRNYLFKISKMRDRSSEAAVPKFAAVPLVRSQSWPAFPKRAAGEDPLIRSLTEQVVRGGIPIHEIGRVGPKKYLFTAIKGKHIDGYVLLFAQPYSLIEENLQALNRRMLILSVLVVFLALLSAKLTSSFMLKPLEQLRTGLEAVSSGNFRVQIEGARVEEFASMINSLNHSLAGFQELQVARSIQETLWPEEQLHGADWHLFGKCVTATELGGDHFDWIRLKDGRLLLVVGDVTGHGIAPAMVQASTKVWLSMYAEKATSAAALLLEISRLHFNYGAKRLYMTCWIGFYSPDTGEIDYAAAGHPYPYLLRADGSIERLVLPGMPVGSREKIIIKSDKKALAVGDSLILYTDGIIEVTNRLEVMLGFEGFEKICSQTVQLSAEASVETILQQAAAWGNQNDDQTVIILKRRALEEYYETD